MQSRLLAFAALCFLVAPLARAGGDRYSAATDDGDPKTIAKVLAATGAVVTTAGLVKHVHGNVRVDERPYAPLQVIAPDRIDQTVRELRPGDQVTITYNPSRGEVVAKTLTDLHARQAAHLAEAARYRKLSERSRLWRVQSSGAGKRAFKTKPEFKEANRLLELAIAEEKLAAALERATEHGLVTEALKTFKVPERTLTLDARQVPKGKTLSQVVSQELQGLKLSENRLLTVNVAKRQAASRVGVWTALAGIGTLIGAAAEFTWEPLSEAWGSSRASDRADKAVTPTEIDRGHAEKATRAPSAR